MPVVDLRGTLLSGRYRLQGQLGRGGMGVIYAAEDLRYGRQVAIKVAVDSASALSAERLVREAKATARINHPAVVTVFGDETDDDSCVEYIVMERLEGETLEERLAGGRPLAVELIHAIGLELADVLAAAHSCGVIHRDIKPANVFLARRRMRTEEIKVMDFGIAKHSDMQTITRPDELLGTLPYLAPELLAEAQLAVPRLADARTDIYALGVTLFEALTSQRPFDADTPLELTRRILQGAPPKLLALRPDAPPALVEVVEGCMRREPAQRFARADEVYAALRACSDACRASTDSAVY